MNRKIGKAHIRRKEIYKYRYYYLLLAPAIVYYIIFSYVPMGGILVAFMDYNPFKGFSGSEWVGFKWFAQLFGSSDFYVVLRNTVLISLYTLIVNFPAPIIFALMLNECKGLRFKKIIQTVSYLPHFISWSVVAGLIVTMLSPSSGIVNQLIKLSGNEPIYFMAEPEYIRGIMVFSSLWKGLGWSSIIYLAALTGISPELYESAVLDGANKLQQTYYITIPGISNIIIMNLIFAVSGLFNVGFEQAYNLVIPATYETGQVISTYVYRLGVRNMQYSFSTAVGLAQSLVAMILLIGANQVAKKFNPDAAIW